MKEKISFNKQCLVVLRFLKTQVENISKLLLCRVVEKGLKENIKLVEDACDRLFCVVSNNTYKCIVVTVCKVKSDNVFYQKYLLKIVHNENKHLKFVKGFVIKKNNLITISRPAVMRFFVDIFNGLDSVIQGLESESATVYLN